MDTKQKLIDFVVSGKYRLSLVDAIRFLQDFMTDQGDELTEDEREEIVKRWEINNEN